MIDAPNPTAAQVEADFRFLFEAVESAVQNYHTEMSHAQRECKSFSGVRNAEEEERRNFVQAILEAVATLPSPTPDTIAAERRAYLRADFSVPDRIEAEAAKLPAPAPVESGVGARVTLEGASTGSAGLRP